MSLIKQISMYADEIKIDTADRPLEGMIVSNSIWGMLRGLESFSQLIYTSQNGVAVIFLLLLRLKKVVE